MARQTWALQWRAPSLPPLAHLHFGSAGGQQHNRSRQKQKKVTHLAWWSRHPCSSMTLKSCLKPGKPFSLLRFSASFKSTRMRAITASSSSSCAADGIARSASIQSAAVGAKPLRMCWEKKLRKTCQKKAAAVRTNIATKKQRNCTEESRIIRRKHIFCKMMFIVFFSLKKWGNPRLKNKILIFRVKMKNSDP